MKETHDLTTPSAGRPKKDVDWELFEQLCSIQCTQSEMSSFLKVNIETLREKAREHYNEQDFSLIYKRFSETGKCSLRRYQFIQAKTKPNMAIWLGKQWLGQRDHTEDVKELVVDELREGIRRLSKECGSEPSS